MAKVNVIIDVRVRSSGVGGGAGRQRGSVSYCHCHCFGCCYGFLPKQRRRLSCKLSILLTRKASRELLGFASDGVAVGSDGRDRPI